jgi:ABC-type amino acid transport substrate-binding protein
MALVAAGCSGGEARDRSAATTANPTAGGPSRATPTLDSVRARGFVRCGVSTGIAGFSTQDGQGQWQGIDVDVCRAIAAAVLGDAGKVRYTPLTTAQRFTALQSGEIDVLSRNTTVTFQRDVQLGIEFPAINWYDGTGFIVRKASKVTSVKDLNGATILGLDAQWAFRIVKQVGNYAESFERHIAPLGVDRGVNRLWKDGGVLYVPALR